jgi:hypothetical protein
MTSSVERPDDVLLRLALVDDTSDIRFLLRRAFERTHQARGVLTVSRRTAP